MLDCGADIFKDTSGGLELERIKEKIRSIWNQVILAQYEVEYKNQKDDDEDYVSKEEYIDENALFFSGETRPESEIESLINTVDSMFDTKEELDPVSKEGKAPTYKGSDLKANNEKGKIEVTSYEVKHAGTSTPSDSSTGVGKGSYDKPSSGKISNRVDSTVKRNFAPMVEKIVEQLLDLEDKQRIGRRKQLFRL